MEIKPGDRVEFRAFDANDPEVHDLAPGTRGTVTWVGAWTTAFSERGYKHRQIGVEWDNGRTLLLIDPLDQFTLVSEK